MRYPIYENKKQLLLKWSSPANVVLDVGYHGQTGGKFFDNKTSPHAVLQNNNKRTYGVDLDGEEDEFHYKANAENFKIPEKFDVIFCLDIIEHVSNAGLFLETVKAHLKPGGKIVLTTPNCFALFNIFGKFAHQEPHVNKQHTCYYSLKTLNHLITRYDLKFSEVGYLRTLDCVHEESVKKKVLNVLDYGVSFFTPKFLETIVVVLEVVEAPEKK